MTENKLPPRIKFHQNHRPAIDAGEYSLTIDSTITHHQETLDTIPSATTKIAVFGERFTLTDQDVRAVFPATGSTGEYSSILPHIILHRNTLPWERHAHSHDKDLPWLVLLLFDETEVPAKKIITVKDLFSRSAGTGYFPPDLTQEVAQHDDEKLTVIDVPKEILDKLLPSTASLKLLAHTRQGVDSKGHKKFDKNNKLIWEENAIIFCNRLPEQGKRSTLHLVSVEGRYNDKGFDFSGGSNLFRLVSLKSWEFYTIEHFKITTATLEKLKEKAPTEDQEKLSTLLDREFAGTEASFVEEVAHSAGIGVIPETYKQDLIDQSKFDKTFDGILTHLNQDILTLRLPVNQNSTAERYLSQGLVPLEHHFRSGDRSVSWYRSPFVPFVSDTLLDGTTIRNLYPETADELTQYDDARGMFDVTYSAAWELGRLLALGSKDFAVSLFHWKRLRSQHQQKTRQLVGNEHLPIFAHSHNHESAASLWEKHLQPWLTQLASFQSIPSNYLVPSELLLPQESIRFFNVDKNWQIALLSGAFSVGGDWDRDRQTSDHTFNDFLQLTDNYITGFLLRSDVVSGWPGLLIDGVDVDVSNLEDLEDVKEHLHTPLLRQLSSNVLLCLFKVELKQVIFHQKPEVMHFGLLKDNDQFFKKSRTAEGDETDPPLLIAWKSSAINRVIDMNQLATVLGKHDNPAQFAMNMIEGGHKVIFEVA